MDNPATAAHKAVLEVNQLSGPITPVSEPVPSDIQQRMLSSLVDEGLLAQLTDPQKTSLSFRSHMSTSVL